MANAKAEEAEQGVAWVRAVLVVFNSVVYLALIHPAGSPLLAWGVKVRRGCTFLVARQLQITHITLARR